MAKVLLMFANVNSTKVDYFIENTLILISFTLLCLLVALHFLVGFRHRFKNLAEGHIEKFIRTLLIFLL